MISIGDVVIIHIDNKPSAYARIESINPDIKPKWYQVRLLFLSFPPQEITWIIKREYLEGSLFAMNDIPMQITALEKPRQVQKQQPQKRSRGNGAEVISLTELRAQKDKKDLSDKT
jgi:hypothetical protein